MMGMKKIDIAAIEAARLKGCTRAGPASHHARRE
jgi:hypothetical protein